MSAPTNRRPRTWAEQCARKRRRPFTPAEREALHALRVADAYRQQQLPGVGLVGDDLTPEDIDSLWAYVVSGGDGGWDPGSRMMHWWEDKKHQVLARLIWRLTRAEAALAKVPTPERIAADAERLERYADALTRIRWCESDPERIADRAIMGWTSDPPATRRHHGRRRHPKRRALRR